MRRVIKRISALAGASLVAWLAAAAACSTARSGVAHRPEPDSVRIPILVYHNIAPHLPGDTPAQVQLDVAPDVFGQQMQYLADQKINVVSFDALIDALRGTGPAPDHAVVLTFDDGWETQFRNAYPVLKQHGFAATFFIYTTPIDHDQGFMTSAQIRELASAGMTIGSHSLTHPQLTRMEPQAMENEVTLSRAKLQQMLGTAPDIFAYPYGAYDDQTIAAVRRAGYRAARELPGGPWNKPSDMFALHSVLVTDNMNDFKRAVGGTP